MLSNFNQEVADHATITESGTYSVDGCPPPSPVLCDAQRSQDMNEFDSGLPQDSGVVNCEGIKSKNNIKPPVPKRKFTSINNCEALSAFISTKKDTEFRIICETNMQLYKAPLRTHISYDLTIAPSIRAKGCLRPALDEMTPSASSSKNAPRRTLTGAENAIPLAESCDMEDALSIYEVYTI